MTRARPTRPQDWLATRGWRPFPFQRTVWRAVAEGESGLLHAGTGAGKTHAVWLAALARFADPAAAAPLTVLWLTPMRALASDTERALAEPMAALAPGWTLGLRTGDTGSAERARQARRLPSALITTPESLSLLLARADARAALRSVRMVVVDEWHELLGNKRGVQVQLALARLRQWNPTLLTWGLSATLGDLAHASAVLLGGATGRLVEGRSDRLPQIDTLLPARPERFPWAGHLGLRMLPALITELEAAGSSLVFLNTRSQAERWYQALLEARPDWAGLIALHHGSLDREVRDWVEQGLKQGRLKAVVCTSSLDLGVDFSPVERVLQIGSVKGVARLLQRAGRAGHAPGRRPRITLVPTHSLELIEAAAARQAAKAGQLEARRSPEKPLDVLVQHLVTVALGGGFRPETLLPEIRSTWAYRELADDEWQWALAFVRQGGPSLHAYPEYRRVAPDDAGDWRVPDAQVARRHRMGIGTIVSDAGVTVQFLRGGRLGTVEESFIARLRPGEAFLFAGRLLELVRVHGMVAYVRLAGGARAAVPRWNGGRMPLSTELADAMLAQLEHAAAGQLDSPELRCAAPLLSLQAAWSALPGRDTLLAESLRSREGWHLFLYPFAGRQVHLGLASLLGWRLARQQPVTFSISVNDYGLELLSATAIDWPARLQPALFDDAGLLQDLLAGLNAGELAQRRFREIARISGLVFNGYPGAAKSARQLQASSSLFYEVFRQHDPDNRLLAQAEHEVLWQELEGQRLAETLATLRTRRLVHQALKRPTPFAFPLMVARFRERLGSEKLAERIARMLAELERAAGGEATTDVAASLAFEQPAAVAPPRRRRRP
ncbi:ligase-associated DNA damage response DEXH box helicase [Chitiniphilus purpureus]|uniref:Ligase-associated DNA damage response DEXH box helicase n=1 Tax=Chitiniphilus purpureus TaxID=2981137 RepID=A0ABY6DRQ1_9NEIS|nr:ligase-associated DNA damage response DEXH box helicase [Chitiniphilus sp. CD1]UXY17044.1 ligase-associated DNA damage response DEXH box helicase [Chitiniphilus sp. CD1]